MFFWKFTRSGKYSARYISLIMDFHSSRIVDGHLCVSLEECKDILALMHDVEYHNSKSNFSAGIMKGPFQAPVNQLGYSTTMKYVELRNIRKLVLGQMTLGVHSGSPLDYGISNKNDTSIVQLDMDKLAISMNINAPTGIIYGTEDKLKAYRNLHEFDATGYYFDLMPKHDCMIEIVTKMIDIRKENTIDFLVNDLKWVKD